MTGLFCVQLYSLCCFVSVQVFLCAAHSPACVASQSKPKYWQEMSYRARGMSSASHPLGCRAVIHLDRDKLVSAGSVLSPCQNFSSKNELCKSNCSLLSSSLTDSGSTGNIRVLKMLVTRQTAMAAIYLRVEPLGVAGGEPQKIQRQQNLLNITAKWVLQHVGDQ